MNYSVIVQRTYPKPGDYCNDIVEYKNILSRTVFSNRENALKATIQTVAYNIANVHNDIYIAMVSFDSCGCSKKIIDVFNLYKIDFEDEPSNSYDTTTVELTINQELTNLVFDEDNYTVVVPMTIEPEYGTLINNNSFYNYSYLPYETAETNTDVINFVRVNILSGEIVEGYEYRITINV